MGFLGFDSDTWGNIIAAGAAAAAILGGIFTYSRQQKKDRNAREDLAEKDRELLLRTQSREAVGRALAAAIEAIDLLTAPAGSDAERRRRASEADGLRRQIVAAGLLIHKREVRHSVYHGASAVHTVAAGAHADSGARAVAILGEIRDLCAAYLRDDDGGIERHRARIERAYRDALPETAGGVAGA
jgi:hypothetical protein